jgi:hypothetical protein
MSDKTQFSFETIQKDSKSKARLGKITTPHGEIMTPAFTPVGTKATVKSLTPEELKEAGVCTKPVRGFGPLGTIEPRPAAIVGVFTGPDRLDHVGHPHSLNRIGLGLDR